MIVILAVVAAFLLGALPFSVWIGQWWLGTDIRRVGDANPGATNVLRAGGIAPAAVALLLDFLKGALPVGIAHLTGTIDGWPLVALALAPVLGHAFSPFLRGRGGKAVATTGGIWCGLTAWEGPSLSGLLLGLLRPRLATDGWAVIAALIGMVVYLLITPPSWNLFGVRPAPEIILATGVGNLLIVGWKHRHDLTWPILRHRATQRKPA